MIETPGLLWTILFFVLAIGPLIFVHELGHYLVGRWCGVRADVFAIGFGREVTGWTDKRGTRWKLCWLPLGGYVKFAGDMNAASMPDAAWQKLPEAERAQTFPAQRLWKRAAIVAAGPITNFLFAILIFMGLFAVYGQLQTPAVVDSVKPGSAAERAGFQKGDRVVSINGREIDAFMELVAYVELRPKELLSLSIERNGQQTSLAATPDEDQMVDRFGNKSRRGLLGIASVPPQRVKLSAIELPGAAVTQVINITRSMIDGLEQIIAGRRSLKELGGPVMIAKYSGQTAAMGFAVFLGFMAMISINLGFINLLPIPMLDGGHLLMYGIEGVARRPVPEAAQEWAFRAGFIALMGLMLFVTFNDVAALGIW